MVVPADETAGRTQPASLDNMIDNEPAATSIPMRSLNQAHILDRICGVILVNTEAETKINIRFIVFFYPTPTYK